MQRVKFVSQINNEEFMTAHQATQLQRKYKWSNAQGTFEDKFKLEQILEHGGLDLNELLEAVGLCCKFGMSLMMLERNWNHIEQARLDTICSKMRSLGYLCSLENCIPGPEYKWSGEVNERVPRLIIHW